MSKVPADAQTRPIYTATKKLSEGAQAKVYRSHVIDVIKELDDQEKQREFALKLFKTDRPLNKDNAPAKEYNVLK